MKLLGDVPLEHHMLAEQLVEWEEKAFRNTKLSNEQRAKIYVCLAHDWHWMGCEEEGERLLTAAERVCPGYFKEIMIKQVLGDKDFDELVKRLSSLLAWTLVTRLDELKGK